MRLTPSEYLVLQMAAGHVPWQKGAWVNACAEFLMEDGLINRSTILTNKGKETISNLQEQINGPH